MRFCARLLPAALMLLASGCQAQPDPVEHKTEVSGQGLEAHAGAEASSLPLLGLMGTIPIYWGEAEGLDDLLAASEPHWARALLEERFRLRPLDTLTAASLQGVERLLLAQPRALSAQENVDLDQWVRNGGQLLLFADPYLTGESHFGLGDRRRPQDVILLSPLMNHWGLKLEFFEDQDASVQLVEEREGGKGTRYPVALAGRLVGENTGRGCAITLQGLLATCRIGDGKAVIFADAALLDLHDPHADAPKALKALVAKIAE